MERLIIKGGQRLNGELCVQGAKNSALPILAASLLSGGKTTIYNCPKLSDVDAAIKILKYLGCSVLWQDDALLIDSTVIEKDEIPQELMHEMRSSIVFLGALISRMKSAKMFYPGGCELGPRPIDLHISSLKRLGITIAEEYGCLICGVEKGICGAKINLSFPSVGATENIMIASVMAKGETIIINAAQEPEIVDLANFLISRGAKIKDAGKSTVIIEGVEKLHSTQYRVMPDRIVVATYLCCAGITGGNITLNHINSADIESILPILEQAGCKYKIFGDKIDFVGPAILKAVKNIRTMPYPGFPTDAQAPVMAMLTLANGTAVFVENIFENRYKHVSELCRMGADIKTEGKISVVTGVKKLYGANCFATDLRGGAALVCAGLAAEGTTTVNNIFHIDRGYEQIENALSILGADVKREL